MMGSPRLTASIAHTIDSGMETELKASACREDLIKNLIKDLIKG